MTTMALPEVGDESNAVTVSWKEKIHNELRVHLDTAKKLDPEWIQTAVALAKKAKLRYLDFRKTLARVLQDKKICLDGYRDLLNNCWYSVA